MLSPRIRQFLHGQGPLLPPPLDTVQQNQILTRSPLTMNLRWIQMVHPLLPTLLRIPKKLLPRPQKQLPCYRIPSVLSILLTIIFTNIPNDDLKKFRLLLGPRRRLALWLLERDGLEFEEDGAFEVEDGAEKFPIVLILQIEMICTNSLIFFLKTNKYPKSNQIKIRNSFSYQAYSLELLRFK